MLIQSKISRIPGKILFVLGGGVSLVCISAGSIRLRPHSPALSARPYADRKVEEIRSPRLPAATTIAVSDVRNLQNEHFLRDLEIEVQNNSSKPVYFLQIVLSFPDIPKTTDSDGIERGYTIFLIYGRLELFKLTEYPTSDDAPINPDERYTFKIPQSSWRGLESHLARRNLPESIIKTVRVRVYWANYGDGTGIKLGNSFPFDQSSINYSVSKSRIVDDKKVASTSKIPLPKNVNFAVNAKMKGRYQSPALP